MRKRWLLILGCLAVLLLAGYVVLWLTPPEDRVTPENVAKIRNGMNRAEVEAILGHPRLRHSESGNPQLSFVRVAAAKPGGAFVEWHGCESVILVQFDRHEAVCFTRLIYVDPEPESFLDKLRRWLGLK